MRHATLKPTYDTVAKKIFQDKEVTKAFITDILNLPVQSVELLDGHQIRLPNDNLPRGLYTVTDILVKLDDNTQVIIEIQIVKQHSFINRLWTYLCTQVHDNFEQVRKEHSQTHTTHEHLYPVYGIALVEKNYFDDQEPFHIFSIREETSNKELTVRLKNSPKEYSLLKIAFLELDKYQPEKIANYNLKKWFEFFGNREFSIQPDSVIAQAEHALNFTTWNKEEQAVFNRELDNIELYHASIRYAVEEAVEEAVAETRESTVTFAARNLIKSGVSATIVSESLNLPLSKVLELQNELLTGS